MQLYVLGLLLLALLVDHFLLKGEFTLSCSCLGLFRFVLRFQFPYHCVFLFNFLSHFQVLFAFSERNVVLERLNSLECRVEKALLDQYFLAENDLGLGLSNLARQTIIIFDAKAGEHPVNSNRKQLTIVEVESESFDLERVRLHFNTLLNVRVGISENLNRTGSILLSHTSYQHSALVTADNLRIGGVFFIS